MNKKQTMALMAAGMISLFGLSGCTNEKGNTGKGIVSTAQADEQKPENKIFEPGTHCYWRLYNSRQTSGQLTIPNGYEVLEIERTDEYYQGSFFVWFINTETVEAEAVKSTDMGLNTVYYYSKPGKVVKKDKQK